MNVELKYGRSGLTASVPGDVSLIRPRYVPGIQGEAAAFEHAMKRPIESPPLERLVSAGERVAIVVPDITRPFPSKRVLPWLFDALPPIPTADVAVIVGSGSHRRATNAELVELLGADVHKRARIVVHDARDSRSLVRVGSFADGHPVMMNKDAVRADRRIVLGFIEPHFMAGFSGGYKGVFPGIADIRSIMHYHRASVIGDPHSTWGCTEGNPTQDIVRANGSLLPVDFLINVTLNRDGAITGFFCGDVMAAHAEGCRHAARSAMVECPRRFPIVVTTNGGHPLDQNLYQTVKGMSAAAQITEPGGLIVTAAACSDGFPDHGKFRELLFAYPGPQELLNAIESPGFSVFDQWEAQLLAMIQVKHRTALLSQLDYEDVRRAHFEPVQDLNAFLASELENRPADTPVAVIPEGPLTIPVPPNPVDNEAALS